MHIRMFARVISKNMLTRPGTFKPHQAIKQV